MTQRITPRYMHIAGAAIIALEQGTTDQPTNVEAVERKLTVVNYFWNPDTLAYEVGRQTSTGSGGTGGGSTAVDATLTSAGSTRLVGQVTVANPTTGVTISNTAFSITNPATAVDATLTSAGSTRLIGQVTVNNPTTSVSLSSQATVTVGNPTTSVSLSSQITASVTGTTSVNVANSPTVVQGAGSTSVAPWYVISTASAGAGSTTVDANLTSAGSTRQVGLVGLLAGSSANTVGAIAQGAGSTSIAPWYVISTASAGAGSTTVDANLTSVGSTKLIGLVSLSSQITVSASGTTAVDANLTSVGSTRLIGTVSVTGSTANTMGSVALVAGTSANTVGSVALVAGTSANTLGSMALVAGTTANAIGSVALVAGTSANLVGGVVINSGTTAITLGAAALLAGSSANTIGNVAQGPGGSSANAWISDGFSYSSAVTSRTSVSTTVDIAVVAANANRKGLIIANLSTAQVVALGMSTGAVTTALANVSMYLQPASQLAWGYGGGGFPNFTGNIRGINITSTVLGGGVAVTQFLNT